MADNKNHDEQLERIMSCLADSVLELSDEEILAETRESGADPQEEAEYTHAALRQASKALETVNKRLWILGHTVNPKHWQHGERGYHNNCRDCGLSVNFTVAGETWGDALGRPCREKEQYRVGEHELSQRYTVREHESSGG
jgi:hypothetical protein